MGCRDSNMTKILLLASNPKDTQSLQLEREISTISEKLRQAPYGHQFVLEIEPATRRNMVSDILNRVQPDIVHFSGHASKTEILLEDNAGNAQPISEAALKEIFHLLRGNIRCVVMNACYAEQQANVIAEEVDCVVGMLDQIDDESAIDFAGEFYRQLASGANVSKAFRLGRTQIKQGKELARLLVFKANPSEIVFVKQQGWLKYGLLTTLVVVLLAAALWFIPYLLPQPTLRINSRDNAVYAWIPPGAFTMGSNNTTDPASHPNERPQHKVILDGFWIMQTEVTNIQYKRCVAANICSPLNDSRWSDPTYAQRPVVNITWDDANTYAIWVGGRLPTEAEWEKACRGTDERRFPWGNQNPNPQRLSYQGSITSTLPVGSYPPGAYGLYDMAGNVFEWVADWHDEQYYVNSPTANPKGPASGTRHTIRGGSFNPDVQFVNFLRCAARGADELGNSEIGFRVASDGF